MRTIELVRTDGKTIYKGIHNNLNEAIESAIEKNISLNDLDLSNTDLDHINLDGVWFHNVSFRGANLSGANMSEAVFTGCDFSSTNLENACLCYSDFVHCNLRLSSFKDTDIAMISLTNCAFEGFNTFSLNFQNAFAMSGCTYTHFGNIVALSTPPTLIQSGEKRIVILDNTIIFKDLPHTLDYSNMARKSPKTILNKIQSLVDLANPHV